ncbi:hypothetical protein PR048_027675 [Dryococelus australis]|uniref:Uncharacterized protein n=1 Tax=Dryococelus australis TaxID=614101 RepID=A0ABQ9GH64_9NEOP|nr:hypothetical protein PR048_027675 [Dryococelus australis]
MNKQPEPAEAAYPRPMTHRTLKKYPPRSHSRKLSTERHPPRYFVFMIPYVQALSARHSSTVRLRGMQLVMQAAKRACYGKSWVDRTKYRCTACRYNLTVDIITRPATHKQLPTGWFRGPALGNPTPPPPSPNHPNAIRLPKSISSFFSSGGECREEKRREGRKREPRPTNFPGISRPRCRHALKGCPTPLPSPYCAAGGGRVSHAARLQSSSQLEAIRAINIRCLALPSRILNFGKPRRVPAAVCTSERIKLHNTKANCSAARGTLRRRSVGRVAAVPLTGVTSVLGQVEDNVVAYVQALAACRATAELFAFFSLCGVFRSVAPSWLETRSEIGSKVDTENRCTIRVQSWTEIEMKFISNRRNWWFEISIRDQQTSSTNIKHHTSGSIYSEKYAYFDDVIYYEPVEKFFSYLISISHFETKIDESEFQNHEISLVQHFYNGTKIKPDSGSELGSLISRIPIASGLLTTASLAGQVWPYHAIPTLGRHTSARRVKVVGERCNYSPPHLPTWRKPRSTPPGDIAPGFLHVGITPDEAAGRRVFSGISRFPRPMHSDAAPLHLEWPPSLPPPNTQKHTCSSPSFSLHASSSLYAQAASTQPLSASYFNEASMHKPPQCSLYAQATSMYPLRTSCLNVVSMRNLPQRSLYAQATSVYPLRTSCLNVASMRNLPQHSLYAQATSMKPLRASCLKVASTCKPPQRSLYAQATSIKPLRSSCLNVASTRKPPQRRLYAQATSMNPLRTSCLNVASMRNLPQRSLYVQATSMYPLRTSCFNLSSMRNLPRRSLYAQATSMYPLRAICLNQTVNFPRDKPSSLVITKARRPGDTGSIPGSWLTSVWRKAVVNHGSTISPSGLDGAVVSAPSLCSSEPQTRRTTPSKYPG